MGVSGPESQTWSATNDDDAELLHRLRSGDQEAYTTLWRKHVSAALRLGRSLAPGSAEDLVSESFLAVYHQVAVLGAGPGSSFRAYLFTVMRNTAIRWQQDDSREVSLTDNDLFEELFESEDTPALELLEKEATASELLDAMQALPDRWQRVLWLTEVEQVSRSEVARDLGIKPNAVSALYRRARTGLRMNWLTLQIPVSLREDTSHAAHLMPRLIVDGRASGIARTVKQHTSSCEECSNLFTRLQADFGHMRKVTLSLAGFLALGGTAPALAPVAGAGGTAVAVGLFGGSAVATGIGLLLSGSLAAGIVVGVIPQNSGPRPETTTAEATPSGGKTAPSGHGVTEPSGPAAESSPDTPPDSEATVSGPPSHPSTPRLGLGNTDPSIDEVVFTETTYDSRPAPEQLPPGSIPPPLLEDTHPSDSLWLSVLTPTQSSGYIAPTIAGTASPGSTVAIEFAPVSGTVTTPKQYVANSSPEGNWFFEFPLLLQGQSGTYGYTVWAVDEEGQTPGSTGEFEVLPATVLGFEETSQGEILDPAAAADSGIVFEAHGQPNGYVCLVAIHTGQEAVLPLGSNGTVVRRIKFLGTGTYWFEFRACDGEFFGAGSNVFVDVLDPMSPGWGPWGPEPDHLQFVIEEV